MLYVVFSGVHKSVRLHYEYAMCPSSGCCVIRHNASKISTDTHTSSHRTFIYRFVCDVKKPEHPTYTHFLWYVADAVWQKIFPQFRLRNKYHRQRNDFLKIPDERLFWASLGQRPNRFIYFLLARARTMCDARGRFQQQQKARARRRERETKKKKIVSIWQSLWLISLMRSSESIN